MQVMAYAKINWTLDITGLSGAWHTLDMIMDTVSLCDELQLMPAPAGEIEVSGVADVSCMQQNLIWRAAQALCTYTGTKHGVRIDTVKRIPSGAGLGGGSADAAAALWALNDFWQLHLRKEELLQIGLSLGSDVPYCMTGGRMRARGRGEILCECGADTVWHLVLAMGQKKLATAQVFAQYDVVGTPQHPCQEAIRRALAGTDVRALAEALSHANALSHAACMLCPEVEETQRALYRNGALAAFMTGSGAACVGLYESGEAARRAAQTLQREVFWCEAVHTMHKAHM